jgi:hypothetical protein
MKGEMDRECRAAGGAVTQDDRKQVRRAFRSTRPTGMAPDASLKRGAGPLFRKRGGKVPEAFRKHDDEEHERDERAAGGAVARRRGGKVEGGAKKPHLGRAGRARGGGVGSDLRPLTSADKPGRPKDRHIMPDSEATP